MAKKMTRQELFDQHMADFEKLDKMFDYVRNLKIRAKTIRGKYRACNKYINKVSTMKPIPQQSKYELMIFKDVSKRVTKKYSELIGLLESYSTKLPRTHTQKERFKNRTKSIARVVKEIQSEETAYERALDNYELAISRNNTYLGFSDNQQHRIYLIGEVIGPIYKRLGDFKKAHKMFEAKMKTMI